jgi:effector-binding domain-containing protein
MQRLLRCPFALPRSAVSVHAAKSVAAGALLCFGLLLAVALSACAVGRPHQALPAVADVQLSLPPYHSVAVQWKQRLDQPYVFLELVGDYADTGRFLPQLLEQVRNQNVAVNGTPFGLFYDDPARTPASELRSRLCLPVSKVAAVAAPLGFDLLPSANVVYARVAGAYPEVPRAYPAMFDTLRTRGWVLDGPIREQYLVDPASVQSFDQLVTEVQMPWRPL